MSGWRERGGVVESACERAGALGRRLRTRRGAVLALVVVAFAVRLPLLGKRVAHWDEARVAWWILQYRASGSWQYFPIIHGPFLFHVDRWLFDVLGPTDAVMRLPVAVVGGLFPASALWYCDHLDDREVVALALLLAVAPLLVFYSRFMRNDLLVAAFCFAGFGGLLRAWATGRRRYLVAGSGLVALGFTTKENALLYLLSWAGAGGLVVAWRLYRADDRAATARSLLVADHGTLRRWVPAAAGAAVVFLAVVVVFYAPRSGKPAAGFDDLAAHPELLPGLVRAATVGSARKVAELWILGGMGDYSYLRYFGLLVAVVVVTAPSTVALAGYGGYREWRGSERPLVGFAAAWAGLGVVGYPVATDIVAGWTAIHVVVPLTIPAAVGLAGLHDAARPVLSSWRSWVGRSADDGTAAGGDGRRPGADRRRRVALAALLVVGLHVGAVGLTVNHVAPNSPWNPYPQPAQPGPGMQMPTDAVAAIAADHPGTDVAYVGPNLSAGMLERLPLPWYVRRAGGSSRAYANASALPASPPPVVVAPARLHDELAPRLSGYRCVSVLLTAWTDGGPGLHPERTHVYVERSALPPGYGFTRSSQRCG